MRKITTTPLLVLAVLLLATGCVGNDASEPASYGKASYSITLGNDMLDAASQVTIKYSDGEKTQSLTIDASSLDGNTWTRTVTADLPADFGFSITFTPKPGSELTRESYALRTTARADVPATLAQASGTTVAYHVDDAGTITASQSKRQ